MRHELSIGSACVESLESRWMLAGNVIHEFPLSAGSNPEKIITGLDGSIYAYEQGTGKLARMRPHHAFAEITIPANTNASFGMVLSPKGDVYFTVHDGIGAYSPKFNRMTIIPLDADPNDIAPGPDGNLWFTESVANKVGRLTLSKKGQFNPNTFTVTTFDVPTANAGAASITTGPGGDLWFGEDLAGQLGEITIAGGVPTIHEFALPTRNGHPVGITSGPDGNVWFTEVFGNKIGRINESTKVVTEFTAPTANSEPFWITKSGKSLYFVERAAGQIGQITTAGAITEATIPSGPYPKLTSITAGPKNTLWFTQGTADEVGELILPLKANVLT